MVDIQHENKGYQWYIIETQKFNFQENLFEEFNITNNF